MVEVNKIWEGVRLEGLNYGLPTTFILLGSGREYNSEDLVREVLMHTKCKWVCIFGEGATQVGMGTLVKGLSSVGMYIEVELGGEVRDPGWLHTVDRWVIDYVEEGAFNYGALRGQDMVRFIVRGEGDFNLAKRGFEALKLFPGTRYIRIGAKDVIPKSRGKVLTGLSLYKEALAFVRGYDRARLYGVK